MEGAERSHLPGTLLSWLQALWAWEMFAADSLSHQGFHGLLVPAFLTVYCKHRLHRSRNGIRLSLSTMGPTSVQNVLPGQALRL